jgi:hypothetical protein
LIDFKFDSCQTVFTLAMISRFHLLLILAIFDSWFIWNIYAVRTHLQQMPGEQIIRKIVKSTDNEMFSATANQSYLSPLLIDRPAGSKNLERIRQHLVQFFHRLEWSIEWDNFTAETPLGSIPMANLIVTHRPQALRKVVLACHYETKREPVGFVGATDSAGPMALLLSLAEWIGPLLGSNSGSDNGSGVGANKRSPYTVQLIFFDGEEAMKFWTETDSLYGSRNLHSRWSAKGSSIVPLEEFNHWPNIAAMKPKGYENRLEEIDLLLLLDLLG